MMRDARPERTDVLIIGAGGGGYPAAFLLDAAGRRVMLVDPIGNLGGDCLAEGCVPSKAVREVSLVRARAKKATAFGLSGPLPAPNWTGILAHKDRVQEVRYAQHRDELSSSHIRLVTGVARLTGPNRAVIEPPGALPLQVDFADLILATGSAPSRLSVPGAGLAVTSHDLFRLGSTLAFPERPVIVGGGYIGVEVASMLQNLGARPVILEATDGLLPGFDAELADRLRDRLSQRLEIRTGAPVAAITATGTGYRVDYGGGHTPASVEGDLVLLATGRHPVLPAGVEELGLDADRAPTVDHQLRTANPHVYAPGDVNGRSMLFHSAVRQSLVAGHVILAGGQPVDAMNFESVPMTVFTEPEVAHVGLTETAARERYGEVSVTRDDFAEDARAQILDETDGFLKLVWDDRRASLVGAQILGLDAAHLIAPLALAVETGASAATLAEVAFPHPMLTEGINRAARAFHA